MPKFEQDDQIKLLDGYSLILEFFLIKHIIIFWLDDAIFSDLIKNALKFLKLENKFKINIFSCPKYDFFDKNQL